MPVTRTLELLPAVFQTEANRKFLNATLDQLLTEPNLAKINGFVGRKFSPTASVTDSYIVEPTDIRRKYQLEPGVVVKNTDTGTVIHHSSYPEILQKLKYYGLRSNNQNSMWESEYYSYNPHIDLDKFVNFNQYYWLPNGPDAVDVFAGQVDLNKTFTVTTDTKTNSYNFSGYDGSPNPDIILARGGTYQFVVDQPGHKFWIQSSPGISGTQGTLSNLSSRNIYGVTNNGEDKGTVTFAVPYENSQDFFVYMISDGRVDYATDLKYSQIQGQLLSDIKRLYGGIDGQFTESMLAGKYIIFNGNQIDDESWTYQDTVVSIDQRLGTWRIFCQGVDVAGNHVDDLSQVADYRVELTFQTTITTNHKVTVASGMVNGGTDWYRSDEDLMTQVPALTAIIDTLYYQDSVNPAINGIIRLVDASSAFIDVTADIIGKRGYTSPNGVTLTNGMKIAFDASVTPAKYQNNEFYVEGVGSSIVLTAHEAIGQEYSEPDYILINRSSMEKSQWAQGNRWFHRDVIHLTAMYNGTIPSYNVDYQARRPIIEFEPNLQLFNFGSIAKNPVDLYDITHTHPFNTVEGIKINSTTNSGFFIDGVELVEGMRVIFAADENVETKNNIWVVSFIATDESGFSQIHLTLADDGVSKNHDTVSVQKGKKFAGSKFWYNNGAWVVGQEKTSVNQAPRFDVFDANGISFGDQNYYPVVTINKFFTGTKLFSYAVGTGTNDSILGFPLEYKNVGNIGDIVFENSYDQDILMYTIDRKNYEIKVNTGKLRKNLTDGTFAWVNNWSKVVSPSRQLQEFNFVFGGKPEDNIFVVDILPKEETIHPTLYVYLNRKLLSSYEYYVEKNTNYEGKPISGFRVYINFDLLTAGAKVDIFVDSDEISSIGSYEFPTVLESNAQNASINTLTLSDLRNHVSSLTRSSTSFSGSYPGPSNLRDINVVNYRGTICQQSANVPLAMMFLTDETANFVDAVIHASREYSRFKNRFLENATNVASIAFMTPSDGVDSIMKTINANKNKSMPWFYSDMVPTGDDKQVIQYNVFNPATKSYEITTITPLDTAGNRAILVYHNGRQLIRGRDYDTSKVAPAIVFKENIVLNVGDVINIIEYSNTDGCYVPETPSKLGLYPKFEPEIFVDKTYVTPVLMIRGHDGSCTPAFTVIPESGLLEDVDRYDFRDLLLLELEQRIFNNIKVAYDDITFGINDVIPGKFRNTGYSLTDFNAVIAKFFLSWVGNNRLDYLTNTTYQDTNTFTWNFRGQPDKISGEELPGSWRACYEYFYDTQTPHLTPWEMLGFSIKPTWWESTYGPAPYTGGNTVLWTDLSRGYIAGGERAGYDARYARPELLSVIPVNEYGSLLGPEILLAGHVTDFRGNRSWTTGSRSPIETAWRKSSEYAYAIQVAMAVMKPGKYFGVNVDRNLYLHDTEFDQYLNRVTHQRWVQNDIVINGENGRSAGYINWIADNLRQSGVDPEIVLGNYVANYEIKLMYHMAGFTDKKYLKILAEQYSPSSLNASVLIPDSDYDLVLTKTTPVGKITYSAVVVEKTTNGYRVSGYDTNSPVFTMIPPDPAGLSSVISVLGESVNIYKEYRKFKISIPYGYEFTSVQQVSNFLIGYGLNLSAQGFRFDEYDQTLEHIKNWELSVKEFLFWAQQGWQNNNIIVLSPVGSNLTANVGLFAVDKVNGTALGGRVLNQNFQPIGYQSLVFSRIDNRFTCSASNQDMIGLVDLNLVQHEHTVILNNTTMFSDVIYKPENGIRQYRLKLVGFKTKDWNGTLFAPGFIYYSGKTDQWQPMRDYLKGDVVQYKGVGYAANKDIPGAIEFNFADWIKIELVSEPKLLPNFAQNSVASGTFYDVDSVNLEDQYDLFGKGLIGYRNRNYLYSLGLDDVSQVKFYQGYIKEKGTLNSFNALGKLAIGENNSSVDLSEEWAFRVGEFGALGINQTLDLAINEKNTLSNPFSVELKERGDSDADIVVRAPYLNSAVDVPESIFLTRDHTSSSPRLNDINTAGFPELADVDYTLFDVRDFKTLMSDIDNIGAGTKIWCANDFKKQWNVYRVVETNIAVVNVNNALDNLIEVTTNRNHGLTVGDVVLLKNAKQFSGLFRVERIPTLKTFVVEYTDSLLGFTGLTGLSATLFTLKSMVFDYAFQVAEYSPPNGWKETDVAWVRYNSKGKWGTYKKITPWNFVKVLPRGKVKDKPLYGTSVNLSVDNQVALVGNPSANLDNRTGKYRGEVVAYTKSYAKRFRELVTFSTTAFNTVGMGQIIEQGNDWAIIGAPESAGNAGYAFISIRTFGSIDVHQVLVAPDYSAGADFGRSVTISQDDLWICVGAPGVGKAYVYGLNTTTPTRGFFIKGQKVDPAIENSPLVKTFVLNFIPESIDSLDIRSDNRLYLPYIDYTVSGATVTFSDEAAPDVGVSVTISQSPGFRLIDIIEGNADDNFGYSVAIATDGAQVVVSAPNEDVVTTNVVAASDLIIGKKYQIAAIGTTDFTDSGSINNVVGTQFTATGPTTGTGTVYEVLVDAGAIYVYDRSIEAFIASGSTVFVPRRPVKSVSKVLINDVPQTYGVDYTITPVGAQTHITFVTAPPVGTRVSIETNQINLIERVVADTPEAGDLLGFNINLCPTNCSLYAGLPMRNVDGKINAGAVIRYFNTGRQAGYNIGTFLDPVTIKLYESSAAGSLTMKAYGTLETYPSLKVGMRIKSEIDGLPRFAVITNLSQTTPAYFTVTISSATSADIYVDTEITFERAPRVRVGDTIRINDFEVEFENSELDDVVYAINAARIPGITASNSNGYLEIVSDVIITRKRLRIMAGTRSSTAIQDLGLRVYPQIQFFTNPYNNDDKYFGKKVRITRALPDYGFLIGSDTASTYVTTSFDGKLTTFDKLSTNLHDRQRGSGAVYMFTFMGDDRSTADFPAGKLAFAQQFVPAEPIPVGLHYGIDFDIQDTSIIIGAPEVEVYGSGVKGSARVYEFENPSNELGWTLTSYEDSRVDIDSINKLFLWNKKTNTIDETLDYIDPAKGKILGQAEQEIKYKTAYDPAMYNRGDASKIDINKVNHWSNKQVGEVWWDLSTVRYIDYEHGSLPFRTSNWGAMFPGSSIDVYEWVESIYLPSEYVANGGNGTPMHPDNSAYVSISVVDGISNREYNKYYFWVKGKTTVDSGAFGRSIPISRVTELIENPRGQDIKYSAAIKNTAVALFNCSDNIKGDEIVLHIDYDTELNSSIIHSEWELVKENVEAGFSEIPEKIFNKLLDSLSGLDSYGNVVPDPLLPVQNRFGIGIRPRQGMFINQNEAVRTLVKYLNSWFSTVPLSLRFDISSLSNAEPIPPAHSGIWDISVPNIETLSYLDLYALDAGYKVLVENDSSVDGLWTIYTLQKDYTWFLSRVQSYDDTPYWDYSDWYASGYDSTTVPNYTVNTMADLSSRGYIVGDIVKVLDDGTGNFRLLEMTLKDPITVGLQNGTVVFNENLYNLPDYGMGWNNGGFGVQRYDQNPSIELRKMLNKLFSVVFTEDYQEQYGKVIQNLINYILTEQKSVDWMFKTNFISVLHKLRKLNQPPVYSKDNQEAYLSYLEEVKPYAATVREYVVDYEGVDNINGYVTDFDVPSYYDNALKIYRGPSGEYYQDRNAIENVRYYDWRYNYAYGIPTGTANIVLHRPGKGYTFKPTVTITGSATDDNPVAEVVSLVNGQITAINVTLAGTNFTGVGVNGVPLPARVEITGGGLPTTYEEFERGLVVGVGQSIRTTNLQYFEVVQAGTLGYTPVTMDDGSRWVSQDVGDIVLSGTTKLKFLGEEATAHAIVENTQIRKIATTLAFDRISYGQLAVSVWKPSTQYYRGDVIYFKGNSYKALTDFVSLPVFDESNLEKYYLTANDRIGLFYQPASGSAGKDPALLQTGIEYPGVLVTGPLFSDDPGYDTATFDISAFDDVSEETFTLTYTGTDVDGARTSFSTKVDNDTNIDLTVMVDNIVVSNYALDNSADGVQYVNFVTAPLAGSTVSLVITRQILGTSLIDSVINSQFTDDFFTSLVDTRLEGIVIDGGSYVDTYNSHAPEELIPGRVHEALDIQVHQTISPPIGGVTATQSPDIQLTTHRVGDYPSRIYTYGNGHEFDDVLYVYSNTRGRLANNIDYTIDYNQGQIQLLAPLGDNDLLFIYAWNQIGVNKKSEIITNGDGVETMFSTEISVGIDLRVFVQIDGVTTTDFDVVDNISNNTQYIRFAEAPAENSYIHIMVYFAVEGIGVQQWSEINTQRHLVPETYQTSSSDYSITLDKPVFSQGPLSAHVIVEINNLRIRPPSYSYHDADGLNDSFEMPLDDLNVLKSINNNQTLVRNIDVYINGVKQEFGVNYQIGDDAVSYGDGATTEFSTTVASSVSLNTIVTVDGQQKTLNVDYTFSNVSVSGVLTRHVKFANAPALDSKVRVISYRNDSRAGKNIIFNQFSIPKAGTTVSIEDRTFAKVLVSEDGRTVTITGTNITGKPGAQDVITIDTFSNHDLLGMETRVFVGGQVYTTEIPVGFDQVLFDKGGRSYGNPNIPDAVDLSSDPILGPYDSAEFLPDVGFDQNASTSLVIAQFDLGKLYPNMNYLWVTLEGRRLMPGQDFVVDGQRLYIGPQYVINDSSIVTITSFAYSLQTNVISYRQFRDITGTTEYLRISLNATTKLMANLDVASDTILVEDPSKLPIPSTKSAIPGVVFINGERITYYRNYATETVVPWNPNTVYDTQTLVSYNGVTYDVIGNVYSNIADANISVVAGNLVAIDETTLAHGLGQVRRGTGGTGAAAHVKGSQVVDGSVQQLVPDSSDRYTVARFTNTSGTPNVFTTTVPEVLNPEATTVLYITQTQVDSIAKSIDNLGLPYTLEQYIATMCTVYVGGTVIDTSLYSVELVPTTFEGTNVYTIRVTLTNAPAAGVWVAVELRTGKVWFNIGIADTVVAASEMVAGNTYQIVSLGTTDFTALGAPHNLVGTQFTASASGTGTGTVSYPTTSALAVSTTNQAKFLKEEPGFLQ